MPHDSAILITGADYSTRKAPDQVHMIGKSTLHRLASAFHDDLCGGSKVVTAVINFAS